VNGITAVLLLTSCNAIAMRRECLRTRSTWSEHDQILFLTLRRGLLLGQAQLMWLGEVVEYIESGKLPL